MQATGPAPHNLTMATIAQLLDAAVLELSRTEREIKSLEKRRTEQRRELLSRLQEAGAPNHRFDGVLASVVQTDEWEYHDGGVTGAAKVADRLSAELKDAKVALKAQQERAKLRGGRYAKVIATTYGVRLTGVKEG